MADKTPKAKSRNIMHVELPPALRVKLDAIKRELQTDPRNEALKSKITRQDALRHAITVYAAGGDVA